MSQRLIMNCWGGLGNQMFEYAAGVYFAAKTARTLELVRPLAKNEHWNGHARPFQLEEFRIPRKARIPGAMDRLFLSTQPRLRQAAKVLSGVLSAKTVEEPGTYQFHPEALTGLSQETVYVNGFWQAAAYVAGVESTLRQQYRLHAEPAGRNAEYAATITGLTCPVSLHLRMGDYSQILHTSATGEKVSLVLRREYYREAIAQVKALFPIHTLVVFSDDQPAARRFLVDEPGCLFVEGNDAATAHEDMRLMSLCRHHIAANSSFSWWGAWLNPRTEKQVWAPKFWGNTMESYYPDLYPNGWHIVDNLT